MQPGSPDSSLLVEIVSGAKPRMPKFGAPLSSEQLAAIRGWIEQGARDDSPQNAPAEEAWWSLRPLRLPAVPKNATTKNPIDAFLHEKLQASGLTPSPPADRRTLARRIYYDLHGLPPTPAEIEAFVNDKSRDAYEKLIDRLLESPRYGERWARHWLDVIHYGDSHGYDKDKPRPNAWPYRDYVIRALNDSYRSRLREMSCSRMILAPLWRLAFSRQVHGISLVIRSSAKEPRTKTTRASWIATTWSPRQYRPSPV
jgi:hypothetical protein